MWWARLYLCSTGGVTDAMGWVAQGLHIDPLGVLLCSFASRGFWSFRVTAGSSYGFVSGSVEDPLNRGFPRLPPPQQPHRLAFPTYSHYHFVSPPDITLRNLRCRTPPSWHARLQLPTSSDGLAVMASSKLSRNHFHPRVSVQYFVGLLVSLP